MANNTPTPLEFEAVGEMPVKINSIESITIENLTIGRSRPLTPHGSLSRKQIVLINEGVATISFSFKLPLLKTKSMTELNTQKYMAASSKPFTLEFSNGKGSITLVGCKGGNENISASAMQGEASADVSGQATEWIPT